MSLELSVFFNAALAGSGGLYAIIREGATVWNGTAFVAWVDGDIANYDVALASQGGDLWAADFPSTIDAGTYDVSYYERTGASPTTSDVRLNGEELYWTGTVAAALPTTYSGRYTTDAVLKLWLATINAVTYADGDGDQVADAGAYQQAIVWGEGQVDFEAGGPLTSTNDDYADLVAAAADGIVGAATVQRWATVLAAYWLYSKRGMNDEKAGGDFRQLRDDVVAEMAMYRDGRHLLDGVTGPATPVGPLAFLRTLSPASGRATVNECGFAIPSPCADPWYLTWRGSYPSNN